ncbi:aromatase/cyclase [Streptomyces sp. NPDC020801]|uniref:aromatase/cyclase n=1 Tax=Streptomyces sp. NPDC020801 TaxID=3365093 RepID=UPI0037B7495C
MTPSDIHTTEHRITVDAPAPAVFGLLAEVDNWPRVFPPTVHVDCVERGEADERIRIWATANDEIKTWTSRRELDRDRLRIRFRQEVSQHPVAAMAGEWRVEALPDGRSTVLLTHDFRAVGDTADNVAWIQQAIDRNSDAELGALALAARHRQHREDLLLCFEDCARVAGSAKDVYDFIHQAQHWPERLPHVARVVLEEGTVNVQMLEMDTRAPDGSVHTTKSVRICFPDNKIVYKQLRTPALMSLHTGQWQITQDHNAAVITSSHTVVVNPDAVRTVLGEQATTADARAFLRDALGRNSTTTMQHAKAYAEHATDR